jgi:hypothetical protein
MFDEISTICYYVFIFLDMSFCVRFVAHLSYRGKLKKEVPIHPVATRDEGNKRYDHANAQTLAEQFVRVVALETFYFRGTDTVSQQYE